MKKFLFAVVLAGLVASAKPMFADGIGTSISGVLHLNGGSYNCFDPGDGDVPGGDSNAGGTTLLLSSNTTFGYTDLTSNYLAVLTGDNIAVTFASALAQPFEMDFTDPALIGVENALFVGEGDLSTLLVGDTLEISSLGSVSAGVFTADLDFAAGPGGGASVTPEPGSIALLGTGLLGMAGVLRRRHATA